ncbi:hypothetical protein ABK040_012853 [Willaertia magna]
MKLKLIKRTSDQNVFLCYFHEKTERWIIIQEFLSYLQDINYHENHQNIYNLLRNIKKEELNNLISFLTLYQHNANEISGLFLNDSDINLQLKDLIRKNQGENMFLPNTVYNNEFEEQPKKAYQLATSPSTNNFSLFESSTPTTPTITSGSTSSKRKPSFSLSPTISSTSSLDLEDKGFKNEFLRPTFFRDASLWEKHNVQVARGLLKENMPLVYYSIVFPYENIFPRLTFPLVKPSAGFYDHPFYYIGNPLTFIGDQETLSYPAFTKYLDFELEVGAILIKKIRNASYEEAKKAVGGYVLLNDFSDRTNQMNEMVKDRFGPYKCKSFGTSIGNVIVTPDEMEEYFTDKGMVGKVYVNGNKILQSEKTTMNKKNDPNSSYYTFDETIAYMSRCEALYPGEVIGSGTIPNLAGIETGVSLKEEDVVTLQMEPFGNLTNKIGKKEELKEWRRSKKNSETKSWLLTFLFYIVFFLSLLIGFFSYLPTKVETQYYNAPSPLYKSVYDVEAPVHFIHRSLKLPCNLKKQFQSPESVILRNGYIYSGLYDGTIRRIKLSGKTSRDLKFDDKIDLVVRTVLWKDENIPTLEECQKRDKEMEKQCGRVLQLKFDQKGNLYIADSTFGVLKVNSRSNEGIFINNSDIIANDLVVKRIAEISFANSIVLSHNDSILYVTSSSNKFGRYEHMSEILDGGANGAFYKINLLTGEVEKKLDNLHFANGVVQDGENIYIAETTRFRIVKYDLNSGNVSYISLDNLRCIPDNLSLTKEKNNSLLLIACAEPRLPFLELAYRYPFIGKFASKVLSVFDFIKLIRKKLGLAIQLDLTNGNIVKVIYDEKGDNFSKISEIVETQIVKSDKGEYILEECHSNCEEKEGFYLAGNVNPKYSLAVFPKYNTQLA